MQLGPHSIEPALVLAPMAGVTDKPFRILARRMGAGLAPSEMLTADPGLWDTPKSRARMDHVGEPGPISVQIAGYCPDMLANAARHNVAHGADIIDINMGCPAKKVCKRDAGSALMQDEALVGRILRAVVEAVEVPVTLKTRTGWNPDNKNAVQIARIAEDAGIAAIAVHGRTRDQKYAGLAEYDTIAEVKQAVAIPVLANGDVTSPKKAEQVLQHTGADGLLVARARSDVGGRRAGRACARPARTVRRLSRCAHRTQTHRLVLCRAPGQRGVSRQHHARDLARGPIGAH